MKKLEKFIVRRIADDIVKVPTGKTAQKFSGMIMANEVSAFIWDKITEVSYSDEMAALILNEFDVSEEVAKRDCKKIFDDMIKAGWIER